MILKKSITNSIAFLKRPEETFKNLKSETLEKVLEDYMKLLLGSGIIAGIISIIFSMLRAVYLQTFQGITIEYLRLLNYSIGLGTGIFFFYLFIGTFGMIIISTIIWLFVRKIKYYEFIKIICMSLYPFFLFSWIYVKAAPMLLIWSLFLLILGIKNYNEKKQEKNVPKKTRKKSKTKK
ncbi:hypothetical protein K9L67_04315 [Candidatus Woesearchaeota archaeon]|nr:hypothetical protein [Candidatus Woesearchaeota archaeon]MCF7901423.1 hypothetical protein [Candidatus Woesearchaeota archaeon]MCF8012964.1 hypothetical protein [Candidatus Woesearchaeota archaeon]